MQAEIHLGGLQTDDDWVDLVDLIRGKDQKLLENLLAEFEKAGAGGFLLEGAYIDRDFSAAYASFYSTLFEPYLKYCRRLHFFRADLSHIAAITDAEAIAYEIERQKEDYLGFIVLRPVQHAPVGSAVIAAKALDEDDNVQIDVRADHPVHILGADLKVNGFALTQQDSRVGACAQAAIWMAGRHFYRDHGGPWFSMSDINEAALKFTDQFVSRSIPAGSDFLRPDNMLRALRAMDRHPVFTPANRRDLGSFADVIGRYLDSGIPVLIGLGTPGDLTAVGHAVVAIGRVMRERGDAELPDYPTAAELISHLIVADDQRGPACLLPVHEADRSDTYPWTLEKNGVHSITPLPNKVFMTGEAAETISRSLVEQCFERIEEYSALARARADDGGEDLQDAKSVDPSFYAVAPQRLVARTYLTHGWRYKARALRNRLPDVFKYELLSKQLPRYVWVTEYSLPDDLRGFDHCQRKVRAHVVVDATGYKHGDSNLVVQVPGVAMFTTFDANNPIATRGLIFRATNEAEPFLPKVRGWDDFDQCAVPAPPDEPDPAQPGGSEQA